MKIKKLLTDIAYEIIQGSDEIEIENLSWDSRKVKKNTFFLCVKSKNVDRHAFIKEAVKAGAIAILVEFIEEEIPSGITVIKVKNTRIAMARIASLYFEEPSKKFNLIGITGTNGKTSISFFIKNLLEALGKKTGIIGTLGNYVGKEVLQTEKLNPTTPDSLELQSTFKEMEETSVTNVVMEVTSTALAQHRVECCDFDIGIFTNFTMDHLDEHGTMENYKNEKLKLFNKCRLGIVNADDGVCHDIIKNGSCMTITYGVHNNADFKAQNIIYSKNKVTFFLDFCGTARQVEIPIPGKFTVYNALATIACCYFLGYSIPLILETLSELQGVPGRFEIIANPNKTLVIIDYAHTPDALENILCSARLLSKKRLILVFGCGGNRDCTKREIMGQIADKYADFSILTSDNPRNENPSDIIADIEKGFYKNPSSYEKEEDRKKAIFKALHSAGKDDIVIVSGKGHEEYQIFGDAILHFSDKEVINEYYNLK